MATITITLCQALMLAIGCNAEWNLHANVNCYGHGHGADDLEEMEGQPCGTMSLSKCQEKCKAMPSCQGVTVETSTGKCYRRGSINIGSCDHGGPTADGYDTWVGPVAKPSWGVQLGNISSSPVTGDDGTVYVGSSDQHLYAVHANGDLRWKAMNGGTIFAPPVIGSDGTIYVISCNIPSPSFSRCINSSVEGAGTEVNAWDKNGTLKWKFVSKDAMMIQRTLMLPGNGVMYIIIGRGGQWDSGLKGFVHAVNSRDGSRIFDSAEITGSPGTYPPAVAQDGTLYVTAFIGCCGKCVPGCSLVRVKKNGATDVLHSTISYLCQGPQISTDGTVYALVGDLMAWSSQGKPKWIFSVPASAWNLEIQSFALGANGSALVQTKKNWGSPCGPSWPLALYGIDRSGNLKWTHNISCYEQWNHLATSEDGTSQWLVSRGSPLLPPGPNPKFYTLLVGVSGNGQVTSNITLQGSDFLILRGSMMAAEGTMALLACVGDQNSWDGHNVMYVLPKDGEHGWSFAPDNRKCHVDYPDAGHFVATGTDGSFYMTAGSFLYKVTKPASLDSILPVLV